MACTGLHFPWSRRFKVLVLSLGWIFWIACVRASDMTSTLIIGGSRIDVTIESGEWKLSQAELIHWVQLAGEAVATYYGRSPVPHLVIRITPFDGRGVRHGTTWGRDGGGLIKIGVGAQTQPAELTEDWMLTHEMVHLAFPSVADEHHWIEEGIATYVEPIARAQVGDLSPEIVWRELVDGLPKGLPAPGDRGLDNTHTWGRTYWGGALYCLMADIEIHQRTNNRYGLQDALRGIVRAGGNMEQDWPLARALKAGDEATGVPVLMELYDRM